MRKEGRNRPVFLIYSTLSLTILLLVACRTSGPTMSVEEARKVAADFKVENFVAPPRTINDLRTIFKEGKAVPDSCEEEWAFRQGQITDTIKFLNEATTSENIFGHAAQLVVHAEDTVSTGRFDQALKYIERANYSISDSGQSVRQAVFLAKWPACMPGWGTRNRLKARWQLLWGTGSKQVQVLRII